MNKAMNDNVSHLNDICEYALESALKAGASEADVIVGNNQETSSEVRLGKSEMVKYSKSTEIAIRVIIDKRQMIVSATDISKYVVDNLVEKAISAAKLVPQDPYCGLADKSEIIKNAQNLDLCDVFEPKTDQLFEMAMQAEDVGLSFDKKIVNSEGAEAGFGKYHSILKASNGFSGEYERTNYSISCVLIASDDNSMEFDYDYHYATHFEDLKNPIDIGKKAAIRCLEKLGSKPQKSQELPIIYDKRVASTLLRTFISAINGQAIARKTSFLTDMMDKQVFAKNINVIDNPLLKRAVGSYPYDAEGILGEELNLIKNGVLKSWLLDCFSARQLNLKSNGRAKRSISMPPSAGSSNCYIKNGDVTYEDMIKDVGKGLLVTGLIGHGDNLVTGDYSIGANGLFIENGEIAYPVSGLTIAGNYKNMFKNLIAANDLELINSVSSPSLLIEGMVIAGS